MVQLLVYCYRIPLRNFYPLRGGGIRPNIYKCMYSLHEHERVVMKIIFVIMRKNEREMFVFSSGEIGEGSNPVSFFAILVLDQVKLYL